MALLQQSTARNRAIFMVDETDHVTGLAGLTLTITASKNGAAFAAITPTVTDRGNGWYNLALTTAHTDTLGDLALHITSTGADPTDLSDEVLVGLPGAAPPTAVAIADEVQTREIASVGALGVGAEADVLAQITTALSTVIADSVPAVGSRPTPAQALLMLTRFLMAARDATGTTMTVYKEDNATTSMTFTLNDATTPTQYQRAT